MARMKLYRYLRQPAIIGLIGLIIIVSFLIAALSSGTIDYRSASRLIWNDFPKKLPSLFEEQNKPLWYVLSRMFEPEPITSIGSVNFIGYDQKCSLYVYAPYEMRMSQSATIGIVVLYPPETSQRTLDELSTKLSAKVISGGFKIADIQGAAPNRENKSFSWAWIVTPESIGERGFYFSFSPDAVIPQSEQGVDQKSQIKVDTHGIFVPINIVNSLGVSSFWEMLLIVLSSIVALLLTACSIPWLIQSVKRIPDFIGFIIRFLLFDKFSRLGCSINPHPRYAESYKNRGIHYINKGKYDLAISDLHQATSLEPEYAEAYFWRGFAYINKCEYDLAITDFDQAIKLTYNHADAYLCRGFAHDALENIAMAVADYRIAYKRANDYNTRRLAEDNLRRLEV